MDESIGDRVQQIISELEILADKNPEFSVMILSTTGNDPDKAYDFSYYFQGDCHTITDALVHRMLESVTAEDGYVYGIIKNAVTETDELLAKMPAVNMNSKVSH